MTDDGHTEIQYIYRCDSARSVFCAVMYRTYNVSTCKIHTYVQDPGILRMEVCDSSQLTIHQPHDHGGRRPRRLLWATKSALRHCGPVVYMVIDNRVAYFDLVP